jgi:uncharacterized RmlC-like cupin family protein
MNYAVEMGVRCHDTISSFIKFHSGIQKFTGGIHLQTHAHRQRGDLISVLHFFEKKESRLKEESCIILSE